MAIWQYELYMLPKEELVSFFPNEKILNEDDFEGISWWHYRHINLKEFDFFTSIISVNKSWSENIIQFGDLESNCIELFVEKNLIEEISFKIDLRSDYFQFINMIIEFANMNNCIFLDRSLTILTADSYIIGEAITIYKTETDKNFE